jgi:hypothetical protein
MRKVGTLAALGVSAIALLAAPPAMADDMRCVFPPFVVGGTFDNVVVPPGETCTLIGTEVRGNVKALENSRLNLFSNSIGGNIVGDKAESVQSNRGTVGGNILIKEGETNDLVIDVVLDQTHVTGGDVQVENMTGDVVLEGLSVPHGNVKVEDNNITAEMRIRTNTVAEDMQVFKNRGGGQKFVQANTIGGNLQCKENDSPFFAHPTDPKFGPNVVGGNAEGQCAQPEASP